MTIEKLIEKWEKEYDSFTEVMQRIRNSDFWNAGQRGDYSIANGKRFTVGKFLSDLRALQAEQGRQDAKAKLQRESDKASKVIEEDMAALKAKMEDEA